MDASLFSTAGYFWMLQYFQVYILFYMIVLFNYAFCGVADFLLTEQFAQITMVHIITTNVCRR